MEREIHNVILFGAGASVDAGIPTLANFIDKMWELSIRGKVEEQPISDAEREILKEANAVRQGLEAYHSRASFDDRNLEDLLSLISFDAMQSGSGAKEKYDKLVQAIAVTIELCCRFKYLDKTPRVLVVGSRDHLYNAFWLTLLQNHLNNLPAIITFNYDLVLERTLWEAYHATADMAGSGCPTNFGLRYHAGQHDMVFNKQPHSFQKALMGERVVGVPEEGWRPEIAKSGQCDVEIPYLKLHGSLNWFDYKTGANAENEAWHPTKSVSKPLILPPVFNKLQSQNVGSVWTKALEVLRQAKHLIIVGHSLPRTDIYMQYFLKAAVGPNSNLSRVFVFNPGLWDHDREAQKLMKDRYSDCFSTQFKNRIEFHPAPDQGGVIGGPGTLAHFVRVLGSKPHLLFFNP